MKAEAQDRGVKRYRPSGRVGRLEVVLGGVGVMLVAGALYGVLTRAWAHIYLTVLITLLVGAVAGGVAMMVCVKASCRNRWVGLAVGILLGGAALVGSYWAQFELDLRRSRRLAEGPAMAGGMVGDLTFSQWRGLRKAYGFRIDLTKDRFEGGFVEFVWAAEALILLGVAGWMGWRAAEAPYCEGCGKWPVVRTVALGGFDADDFWSAARMGSVESIRRRPHKLFHNGSMALVLEGHVCERCRAGWVNARQRIVTKKGGKDVVSYKRIAKGVEMGKGDGEFFLNAK